MITEVTEIQRNAYVACSDRINSVVILNGGIRNGKTMFGIFGFMEYIISHINKDGDYLFAILGHSVSTIESNVERYILQYLNMRGIWFRKTKYKFTFKNGVVLKYYGASNAISFVAFQGATLKGVFIDEAPLLDEYAIQTAHERTLTYKGDSKVIQTSNPEGGPTHPYYIQYVKDHFNRGYKVFKFTLIDSPIFTKEDIEKYRKEMDEATFARKILGEWVIAAGGCYPKLPDRFTDEDIEGVDFEMSLVGEDEGRVDSTVAYLVNKRNGHYFVTRNFRDDTPNASLVEIAANLRRSLNNWAKEFGHIDAYFETNPGTMHNMLADNAALDYRVDINFVSKKKENYKTDNAIQERIDITNMLIHMGRLHVHKDCEDLIVAMSNAVYDKDAKRLDNGTFSVDDLDAFEYAIKIDIPDIYEDYYEWLEKRIGER